MATCQSYWGEGEPEDMCGYYGYVPADEDTTCNATVCELSDCCVEGKLLCVRAATTAHRVFMFSRRLRAGYAPREPAGTGRVGGTMGKVRPFNNAVLIRNLARREFLAYAVRRA